MALDIKVPSVGESINEVTLAKWLKPNGSWVERDEVLAELESEKATFELNAEQAGILNQTAQEGDTINIGDTIGSIDTDAANPAGVEPTTTTNTRSPQPASNTSDGGNKTTASSANANAGAQQTTPTTNTDTKATPLAAAIMADKQINPSQVKPSGYNGKILKSDVLAAVTPGTNPLHPMFSREEKTERMSTLRRTVSKRLVDAKNKTAMLTTFNELNMEPIMEIRKKYKDVFKEKHGVNLGFMSFFIKAATYALQAFPAVNAYIDNEDIIYHNYCDVSIAVSAPKGLVVPVIRNAESLTMAELEQAVVSLAIKARTNKLSLEEMAGGTFTITNGGVFGSMLSTPILNIPQSAILGMHNIVERPIAQNGQVVIKPIMYLALSYDHRIIDGKDSVGFLVMVKNLLENPDRLLYGVDPVQTLLEV